MRADDGAYAREAVRGDQAGGASATIAVASASRPARRRRQVAQRRRRRGCAASSSTRRATSSSRCSARVRSRLGAAQRRQASACSRRNSAIGACGGRAAASARGGQPRPADFAGEAEHVEHRRLVAVDARGQHVRAPTRSAASSKPSSCGRLRAGRRCRSGVSTDRDVLPGEEEAHEVGGADRLDLGAQPVQRVAMDSREQPPVAPFERRSHAPVNCAAQDDAFAIRASSSAASASVSLDRRAMPRAPPRSSGRGAPGGRGGSRRSRRRASRRAPRATAGAAIAGVSVDAGWTASNSGSRSAATQKPATVESARRPPRTTSARRTARRHRGASSTVRKPA